MEEVEKNDQQRKVGKLNGQPLRIRTRECRVISKNQESKEEEQEECIENDKCVEKKENTIRKKK